MRMLAERIDDEPLLRLIKKWLKAGVLDTDGKVLRPESGTPQVHVCQHWRDDFQQEFPNYELKRMSQSPAERIIPVYLYVRKTESAP